VSPRASVVATTARESSRIGGFLARTVERADRGVDVAAARFQVERGLRGVRAAGHRAERGDLLILGRHRRIRSSFCFVS